MSKSLNEYIEKWVREIFIPLHYHCQCVECRKIVPRFHASDCAVHNAPAYLNGPCNCTTSEPGVNP